MISLWIFPPSFYVETENSWREVHATDTTSYYGGFLEGENVPASFFLALSITAR